MALSIQQAISNLVNSDEPLLNSRLADLSNLNPGKLRLVEGAWLKVEPKRRQQIMHRLVELAEDNPELNFDSVFKRRLGDEDAEVRRLAIEGLWENEEPSLLEPLIRLLHQDSSEQVQAAATTALGKFAILAEHEKLRSCHASRICQALLSVIDDTTKPVEIKRRALEAASPLNLPEVKEAIIQAYQSHNPRLKISSVYAMGKSYDDSWLPMIVNELASADAEMRYEAVMACGELEEEAAVPSLVKLIDDPDAEVQLATIQALGKIGGSQAKRCLKKCLGSSEEEIRQAAEESLYELESAEDPLSFRTWTIKE